MTDNNTEQFCFSIDIDLISQKFPPALGRKIIAGFSQKEYSLQGFSFETSWAQP